MNRTAKIACVALLFFSMMLGLAPASSKALPPSTWIPGSEAALFGHTFAEEYWTDETVPIETPNGTANFIASYVNYSAPVGSFQAMMVALDRFSHNGTTPNTNITLPYQLFGLHFTTPNGRDVFVGAMLAFLYAWNDTTPNGYPNAGEQRWFLVPYGFESGNSTGTYNVEAITATKISDGHYQFGVKYTDLYMRVVDATNWATFLLTLHVPILELTFSEFTVTYDIEVDTTTGEITAETFYDIGQITDAYWFGTQIPNPLDYLQGIGIGAAHFVVVFTSQYQVAAGSTTPSNATNWMFANVTAGGARAFAVGTRGTYDVLNETGHAGPPYTMMNSSLPAYSWILTPTLTDLLLIAWQLPISADIYSVFAYAMSPYLQSMFSGPLDLYLNATTAFGGTAFWYGIAFSEFNGYRIEHDPTYTAYSNIGQGTTSPPPIPGFPLEAVGIGLATSLGAVFLVRRRRRKR